MFVSVTNDSLEGLLGEVGVGERRLMPALAWDECVLLPHSPQLQEEAKRVQAGCAVRTLRLVRPASLSLRREQAACAAA